MLQLCYFGRCLFLKKSFVSRLTTRFTFRVTTFAQPRDVLSGSSVDVLFFEYIIENFFTKTHEVGQSSFDFRENQICMHFSPDNLEIWILAVQCISRCATNQ